MRRLFQFSTIFLFSFLVFGNTAVSSLPTYTANSGPCAVSNQTVTIDTIETTIYFPTSNTCGNSLSAPYPAIAFAHGFSLFGFSDGRAENSGHGSHLASWGYVVAIPTLPDEADPRASDVIEVLDYLAEQTAVSNSFLYNKVDNNRFATAGYSLGGTTALMVAARDSRIQAVFALDPVFHTGGPGGGGDPIWDPELESDEITMPVGMVGGIPDSCNDQADYSELYALFNPSHKASYEVNGASHCAFADPGNAFCSFTCSGNDSGVERQLSQTYMSSWFNYYLHYQTNEYANIYGTGLDNDVNAGSITPQIDTLPKQFTAADGIEAVLLSWQETLNPMVANYELFRRVNANSYPIAPYQQLPNQSQFIDTAVSTDNTYFYELQAIDPAGNPFQRSTEVSASPVMASDFIYLPIAVRE